MLIAHARREKMESVSSHDGAANILAMWCFHPDAFDTPWRFIDAAILPSGSGIGHHGHEDAEEIFVTVDNAAQFTHNGRTAEVIGGAAVPVRSGESHGIYNHTDRDTQFYNFHVQSLDREHVCTEFNDDLSNAPLESAERLPIGRFDRSLLTPGRSHEGKGEILSRMIWESRDFRTNFGFFGHAVLPPGTSVGYHRHDSINECYVIMNGCGRMTVDDETLEVHPGDVTVNRIGGSHGLYNHTDENLEMFVVAVCLEKGKIDATNHGDDLSDRID